MFFVKFKSKDIESNIFEDEEILYHRRVDKIHYGIDKIKRLYKKFITYNNFEILHKNVHPIDIHYSFNEDGKLNVLSHLTLNKNISTDMQLFLKFYFEEITSLREQFIVTLQCDHNIILLENRLRLTHDEHQSINYVLFNLNLNKNTLEY